MSVYGGTLCPVQCKGRGGSEPCSSVCSWSLTVALKVNRRKPDSLKKGVITDFRQETHKVGLDLPDHM